MKHLLKTIPFLDVEIKICDTGIKTWVYRKPTNTYLFLNFNSMCPSKWNFDLIFCLLNCTKRIYTRYGLYSKHMNQEKLQIFEDLINLRSFFVVLLFHKVVLSFLCRHLTAFFKKILFYLSMNLSQSCILRSSCFNNYGNHFCCNLIKNCDKINSIIFIKLLPHSIFTNHPIESNRTMTSQYAPSFFIVLCDILVCII